MTDKITGARVMVAKKQFADALVLLDEEQRECQAITSLIVQINHNFDVFSTKLGYSHNLVTNPRHLASHMTSTPDEIKDALNTNLMDAIKSLENAKQSLDILKKEISKL